VELKRELVMTRLLTLTGVGGSGKTRLALKVARDLVGAYQDGVWLVELAGLSEQRLVPQAVARTMRVCDYAKVGPELLEMADEGLVLAARAKARLGQSLSAAQHTEGHLQVVGVGEWKPTSTRPSWDTDPRVSGGEDA
jgi:hypothetical protein